VFCSVLALGVDRQPAAGTGDGRWAGSRPALNLVLFVAAALLAIAPWLVRSSVTTGNPIFPFLDGVVFDSPYWSGAGNAYVNEVLKQQNVGHTLGWLLRLPLLTVTRAKVHHGIIGPLFLLLLPALLVTVTTARGAPGRLVRRLALYAVLAVAVWFATGFHWVRYVSFVLPVLSMLAAFAIVEYAWPGRLGGLLRVTLVLIALGATVLNFPLFVPFQTDGTGPEVAGPLHPGTTSIGAPQRRACSSPTCRCSST
jgi:hypothetical protein